MTTFERPKNERERRFMEESVKTLDSFRPDDILAELQSELIDLPCHDVWNWESENGSWIKAMKQAGLDKDTIWKVLKNRDKTVKLHPGDAAEIWWKFNDKEK